MKQEKLCETEDMTFEDEWDKDGNRVKFMPGNKEFEELGAANIKQMTAGKAQNRQIGGTHYKNMTVQPWEVVDQGPKEQAIGYYRHSALAYIMRAGEKGEFKEDIAKAQHYLEKLLEIL